MSGEVVDDGVPARRPGAGRAGHLVPAGYGVRAVGGGGDPDEDDRCAVAAEGRGELDGAGDHLGARERGGRCGGDAVLEVDEDQCGAFVECAEGHRAAFRRMRGWEGEGVGAAGRRG